MSAQLTPDFLASEAQAIFQAAGQPGLETLTSVSLSREGQHCFTVIAYDPDGQCNPLDVSLASAFGNTVEETLAQLAYKVGVAYPLPLVQYATGIQRETLKRLLDAVDAGAAERAKHQLALNRYTYQELEVINSDLNRRVGIAAAAEAQRENLSALQRQAA
jgi:hypothetical protein